MHPFMFRLDLLKNDQVRYANQPIAVVIPRRVEAATEGAALFVATIPGAAGRVARCGESSCRPAVCVGESIRTATWVMWKRGLADRVEAASMQPTKRPPSYTTPWSLTPSWRRGDGDCAVDRYPSKALAMAQGRIAGCSASSPRE